MKTSLFRFGTLFAAVCMLSLTAGTQNAAATNAAPPFYKVICTAYAAATGEPSGVCMSYFASALNPADADDAAMTCKLAQQFGFNPYKNVGLCVSWLKSL